MSQTTREITDQFPQTEKLTESERHSLLGEDRRRLALDILAERQTPIGLAELTKAVTERADGIDASNEAARERVKVSLHHKHLPKMDAYGVIDYDPESNLVET